MSVLIYNFKDGSRRKYFIEDNADLLYIYDQVDDSVDIIGKKRIYSNVKKLPKQVTDIINRGGVIDLS
jgi:hypothetical protein